MTHDGDVQALPTIIQGGMGVSVSNWRLARAVARRGQLGVVSGTAIERVLACRLQEGDPGGELRAALKRFPDQALAERVLADWFRPEGLERPGHYKPLPMFALRPKRQLLELAVAAAFVEVDLAKHGHAGPVGINLLEKIQLPTLPVLYGALLAKVDWVCVGAGIPRDIPQHLDRLCRHQASSLRVTLPDGTHEPSEFDPAAIGGGGAELPRPRFLAIIASDILALSLSRAGGVDGFVVEGPTAGGHNAPPRGGGAGEESPVYGPRDQPNLERIRGLGLPFWLAGGFATAERLEQAQAAGAQGVQIGTAFAFCRQSGIAEHLKAQALADIAAGRIQVETEGRASPTGFPFKVLRQAGTEGGRATDARQRQTCSLGYLRSAYRRPDGSMGWRCPAEPVADYVAKGGDAADTVGRRCICHGLMSTAGHPYAHPDGLELPLLTPGNDLSELSWLLRPGQDGYDADDVLDAVLGVRVESGTAEI